MKRIATAMLVLVLCNIFISPAYAEGCDTEVIEVNVSGEAVARTEETVWVFRTNNGRLEKRLWSYTYAKWLTDWIDVGAAT